MGGTFGVFVHISVSMLAEFDTNFVGSSSRLSCLILVEKHFQKQKDRPNSLSTDLLSTFSVIAMCSLDRQKNTNGPGQNTNSHPVPLVFSTRTTSAQETWIRKEDGVHREITEQERFFTKHCSGKDRATPRLKKSLARLTLFS